MSKVYVGTITERHGEMECTTKYLFRTKDKPEDYSDNVAANWRGEGTYDDDYEAYWHGTSLTRNDGFIEVTLQDYDVLIKHLSLL